MEREEWEGDLEECSDCGAAISVEMGPSFVFGENRVLCLECAIRRGGKYDADEERWIVPPSVDEFEQSASQ